MLRPVLRLAICLLVMLSGCGQNDPVLSPDPATLPAAPPRELGDLVNVCDRCHIPRRDESHLTAPFIAGQQRDYLVAAITAYTNGKRQHVDMNAVAATLTATQINALARYYNSQSIAWSGLDLSMPPPPAPAPDIGAITVGKRLSTPCAVCHGPQGISSRPGIPSLAGMDAGYLASALRQYVYGARISEIMSVFQYTLEERDIQALAAYFSSLPPGPANTAKTLPPTIDISVKGQCDGCHGADGNPLLPDMPRLAGQDQTYLTAALTHYRDKRRPHAPMREVAAPLGDTQIQHLAAFYAAQQPHAVTTGAIALDATFDAISDGRQLAMSCNGCHLSGEPGIPVLDSLHPAYLTAAMVAYQNQRRTHATMERLLAPYNAVDLEKLSHYYAIRPPPPNISAVEPDHSQNADQVTACDACHGRGGNSTTPSIPSLAGQDAEYLIAALNAYAAGQRRHQVMATVARALSPQQRRYLAAHYASRERTPLNVRVPKAPTQLAQRCNLCHGPGGASQQSDKPRLAGQLESYLLKALMDYQSRRRHHAIMYNMTKDLTPLELRAIAAFYAGQQ